MSGVSVIVPCYNKEEYVGECIESLLASTFPLSDMELIFVDDASTDGTCGVIREYEKRYPENIMLVECSENGRPGTARNIGLQYASGKYITFVDADDKVSADMISRLYDKAAAYDCDIVTCGYRIFSGDKLGNTYTSAEHFYSESADEKKSYIAPHWWRNSACAAMYPKSFLDENNIRFPEKVYMEDLYFSTMCTMYAKSRYVINEPLYWYRGNTGGVMSDDGLSKYYMDSYYMMEKVYRDLTEKKMLEQFYDEFAVVYYYKAFVEPVSTMHMIDDGAAVDTDRINMMRNSVYEHFPDIEKNPYIHADKSELNRMMYRLLTCR